MDTLALKTDVKPVAALVGEAEVRLGLVEETLATKADEVVARQSLSKIGARQARLQQALQAKADGKQVRERHARRALRSVLASARCDDTAAVPPRAHAAPTWPPSAAWASREGPAVPPAARLRPSRRRGCSPSRAPGTWPRRTPPR